MINRTELQDLIEKALVEMFEREYRYKGDLFATAEEWERIQAEPLEYSDLVKGMDAGELLRQIMLKYITEVEAEREQAESNRQFAEQRERAQEAKRALAAAIAEFPAEFGLRNHPGRTFRISKSASYVNDAGQPMLYIAVKQNGYWLDFAKGTPAELRAQVITRGSVNEG
jgi:hypothetical protein